MACKFERSPLPSNRHSRQVPNRSRQFTRDLRPSAEVPGFDAPCPWGTKPSSYLPRTGRGLQTMNSWFITQLYNFKLHLPLTNVLEHINQLTVAIHRGFRLVWPTAIGWRMYQTSWTDCKPPIVWGPLTSGANSIPPCNFNRDY